MTRHLKKTIALVALVGAFMFGQVAKSEAAFFAAICNDQACSGGDDIFVNDGGAGDSDAGIPGSISVSTSAFGYEIAANSSTSKPILVNGGMDLSYRVVNSTGGNTSAIWLYAVDTGFDGPRLLNGHLGGTAPAGTTTTALICGGDSNVPAFSPCASASDTGPLVGISILNYLASADPYALAIGVSIDTLGNNKIATGDFEITAAPEPASMALFGLGLAGFASYRRRQQMQ